MVAAISGGCIRGVTCVACAPAGLGRCTRMHKELKPRSMSETGHLPTDVESSDRDPGAATLQPGPYPPSPLLSSFYLDVLSLYLSHLLLTRRNLPILSAPRTFVRHSALCESHPVFSTCLWTSFGSSRSTLRVQCASRERCSDDIFRFLISEVVHYRELC